MKGYEMIYNDSFKIRTIEASSRNTARPSVIVDILNETAGGHLDALGINDVEMHEVDKKAFIISRMTMEIYDKIPAGSPVDVNTWYSIGKAANFPRNYQMVLDDKIVARGFSNWALIDTDNKKLIRYKDYDDLSDELAEEKISIGIPDRFRIPAEAEFTQAAAVTVALWQTDINNHMNNVRYIDPMWSALPDIAERDVKAVSIHYMHEAVVGDTLKVMVSQPFPFDLDTACDEGTISNHYSAETDQIVYVRMETDDEIKVQAMWILTK